MLPVMTSTMTATDTIADILARRPDAARLLIDRGMHCVGCAMSRFETLAEACATHGIPADDLLRDLNREGGSRPRATRRVTASVARKRAKRSPAPQR